MQSTDCHTPWLLQDYRIEGQVHMTSMTSQTDYSTQTQKTSTLFSGQYLCNHWTLDIGVLGYIGIVWPKEHSPEFRSFPPGTPWIPKKHKRFGIKIYKLCDETGCTYDMTLYVGKDRQRTAQHLTATHVTLSELTKKIWGSYRKSWATFLHAN